ncbi:putative transporter MCH4 [Mycena sanguinolenta]|uniref:Putative transporter MCH4 n=1 Tax=Mycena sanguinolenta TaxID=230812 RepID=A0A8H6XRH9_9AGAR|nr:putative transporter MCH4 [Mycena sanguinolenta]
MVGPISNCRKVSRRPRALYLSRVLVHEQPTCCFRCALKDKWTYHGCRGKGYWQPALAHYQPQLEPTLERSTRFVHWRIIIAAMSIESFLSPCAPFGGSASSPRVTLFLGQCLLPFFFLKGDETNIYVRVSGALPSFSSKIIRMASLEEGEGEGSDVRPSLEDKEIATQSDRASSSYHLNSTPHSPEGSTRGYLTMFGAFMALFCTFGQMNAFGTFQTWYAEHQLSHLEPSTIAWIGSLQLWVFFFSGGLIGQFFDAYGPQPIMLIGSIVYIFSIMMTSISTHYYQYMLAHGVLFGLGVGMLFYPSLSSTATYFCKYRATALGIVASGSSFGGIMYPILLRRLFQLVGFGWGVRISGLLSGVMCCVGTLTVTSASLKKQRMTCRFSETLADSRFLLLAAGSSFVALGLFIPFFYIIDYGNHLAIPAQMSFIVLAVMNTGGVVGRIAPAWLSDIFGRFNLLAPAAFLSGLLCVVFWLFARSLVPLMLFAAAYGFTSGAFISVITPCVAQISDIQQIGSRIGLLYSIISFPALVGGPAAGALLEAGKGQYSGMILFAGLTVITGSLLIFAAKLMIDPRLFARV